LAEKCFASTPVFLTDLRLLERRLPLFPVWGFV